MMQELAVYQTSIYEAERRRIPSPRIVFVSDREFDNLEASIVHSNANPRAFELGGVVVPGGELDNEIIRIADSVRDMRSNGLGIPKPEEGGTMGMDYISPNARFYFSHASYDAKQLKNAQYRKSYSKNLADITGQMSPDLVFLANFKVFLDPVFVERFEGKIINVHPSVLPLIKGFKPETRAMDGENPQAAGYTFHFVDTDMDGGPTLFQQQVEIDPYNPEEEATLGKNEYTRRREEHFRKKIIVSQAKYTPEIFALVLSDVPQMIVEDQEAFTAEGRPEFALSDAYSQQLKIEYEEWQQKQQQEMPLDEWFNAHRKSYRRVLFQKDGAWQTAEKIFNASPVAEIATPHPLKRYQITIPGGNTPTMMQFANAITAAQLLQQEGAGRYFHSVSMYYPDGVLRGSILTTTNLEPELVKMGIEFEVVSLPTRVGAPRKPITWQQEMEEQT